MGLSAATGAPGVAALRALTVLGPRPGGVVGTFEIPLLLGLYSDSPSIPSANVGANLGVSLMRDVVQREFFDDPAHDAGARGRGALPTPSIRRWSSYRGLFWRGRSVTSSDRILVTRHHLALLLLRSPRFIQDRRSSALRRSTSSALRSAPWRIASSQVEGRLSTPPSELSATHVGSWACDGAVSAVCAVNIGCSRRFMGWCGRVSLNKSSAQPLRFSSFPRNSNPSITTFPGGAIG